MSFSSDRPLLSNQLPLSIDYPDPQSTGFLDTLSLDRKRIADAMNTKEGALYLPIELATFQKYFVSGDPQRTRNTYRMTVDFGALPNNTSKSVAHGIAFDSNCRMTRMYGAATNPINVVFVPLPYVSQVAGDEIQLFANATDVVIVTATGWNNFEATVVLEYTKNI